MNRTAKEILTISVLLFLINTTIARINKKEMNIIYETQIKKIKVYYSKHLHYMVISDVADLLNGTVSYLALTGKVTLRIPGQKISFIPNSEKITVGEKTYRIKHKTIFLLGKLLVPFSFLESKLFEDLTEHKFRILNAKTISLTKKVNLYPPRIYTTDEVSKISFQMEENLSYEFDSKKNSLIIYFYEAKTINKINKVNKFIETIKTENLHRKVRCTITMVGDYAFDYHFSPSQLQLTLLIFKKPEKIQHMKEELQRNLTHQTLTETSQFITPVTGVSKYILPGKPKIVIDPGHGGIDPGAVGENGTQEKDINLKIALELKKIFEENGVLVSLTRETDEFVPLVERTNFANKEKADIFISIHCNAKEHGYGEGFEVYYLSEEATDADAAAIAMRENRVVEYEMKDPKLSRLQEILWSMKKNIFMNESAEICGYISRDVSSRLNITNKGVKQANFFVLRGTDMPAILVECAYIDNPTEEMLLNQETFQQQTADAIFSGVASYLEKKWKSQ